MTAYVFQKKTTCPPLHVLVICAGVYGRRAEGKFVPSAVQSLQYIEQSAARAAQHWIDADAHGRLIGRQLGTVQLLVSATDPNFAFQESTPLPAISENVTAAIRTWLNDCATEGALGVLHWIGHGITHVESGTNVVGIQTLCEDSEPDAMRVIDMGRLYSSMSRGQIPSNCMLFIDACRELTGGDEKKVIKLDPLCGLRVAAQTYVDTTHAFRLSEPGDRTLAFQKPNAELGFRGGALMTEALIDAFQYYAAKGGALAPSSVDVQQLEDAVRARFSWWRSLFKGKRVPRFQSIRSRMPSTSVEFLHALEPRAMLDVCIRKRGGGAVSKTPYVSGLETRKSRSTCTHSANGASSLGHTAPQALQAYERSWRGEVIPGGWCYFGSVQDVHSPPHYFKNVGTPGICPAFNSSGFPDEESPGRVWEL